MRIVMIAIAGALLLQACNRKNDYNRIVQNPLIYSTTVHELNNVVMGNNFSPIVASRNYMYANVAAYEVIAAGYPEEFESLGGQLHGLGAVPQPDPAKKIDFEFASLLAFSRLGEAVTFPEGSMSYYTDSIKLLMKDHGMPTDVYQNSVAFADTVSSTILAWSKKDNYAQTRTSSKYAVLDMPGRWVPTPPAYTSAMEPHWNEIRPLVLDSASMFMPPRPPVFNIKDTTSKY
jgi:hypothetical protein